MSRFEYPSLQQREVLPSVPLTLYQILNSKPVVVMKTMVLAQEPGLRKFQSFIKSRHSFQQVEPFLFDPYPNIDRQRYLAHVNFPGERGSRFLPQTPSMQDVLRRGNSLLTIPLENQLYRWLDFYEVEANNQVNIHRKIDTVRVDKRTNKIISDGWFGPEREAFYDHLSGLAVPESLYTQPFVGYVGNATDSIYLGVYHGVIKSYSVQHQNLHTGDIVQFRKATDGSVHWLEGRLLENGVPGRSVFSQQILYDATGRGQLQEWYIGIRDAAEKPKIHALVQGILGKSSVPFDELPQVTLTVPEGKKIHLANARNFPDRPPVEEEYAININLANYDVQPGEKVDIIPRSHPRGFYDWLSIQKDGVELGTKRVTRWKKDKLDGRWLGPTRQAYSDFMMQTEFPQGTLQLSDLNALDIMVAEKGVVNICKTVQQGVGKLRSVIVPHTSKGQIIHFVPFLNTKEQLSFMAYDKATEAYLAQYEFNQALDRFTKIASGEEYEAILQNQTIGSLLAGAEPNPHFEGYDE